MKSRIAFYLACPLAIAAIAVAQRSGNYLVGGPTEYFRSIVADLRKDSASADDLKQLDTRIQALKRVDLGEEPYFVKLDLELRLLEAIERTVGNAQPRDSMGTLTALEQSVSRTTQTWISTHFTADDSARINSMIRGHTIKETGVADALLAESAGLPKVFPPVATSTNSGAARVVIQSINDGVGGTDSEISVLSLDVNARTESVMLRRVTATTAVDGSGRSLLSNPRGGALNSPMLLTQSLSAMVRAAERDEPTPIGGSLSLLNPADGTRTIKLIEGDLEIYAPSAANGGIASIPDFAANPGKPIENPMLSRYGIEIVPLTAGTYPAIQSRLTFRGGAPLVPKFDDRGTVLYIRDPSARLGGIVFQDSSGKYIPFAGIEGRATLEGGILNYYPIMRPLPAGAKLLAYIVIPEAMLTIPFRFENVSLP